MKIRDYKIIGFKGEAGSGKTTAANRLLYELPNAHRLSFAAPLKDICFDVFSTSYGVPHDAFYGSQDQKNAEIPQLPGWSGRKILQYIGTEGFRHISAGIWPRYAMQTTALLLANDAHSHVVFDDLRFLSEGAAIKEAGGVIIGITGGHRSQAEGAQGIPNHTSETELSRIPVDYTIDNSGTKEQFYAKLQELL